MLKGAGTEASYSAVWTSTVIVPRPLQSFDQAGARSPTPGQPLKLEVLEVSRLPAGPYTVTQAAQIISRIHGGLESIEDYRLKLKWWMGYVLRHTRAQRGMRRKTIDQIVELLHRDYGIRLSKSSLYECLKLYDVMGGDVAAYLRWIDQIKLLYERPVYWYDVQRDLLGGRNNPDVIGREEADRRDYHDAERAVEAIERIIIRAHEGNEEAAGVLEAMRQSILGLQLLGDTSGRSPRSSEYLTFVGSYPCVVCAHPAEPHHALGRRGVGVKPSDFGCVPLCRAHHNEFHGRGPQTFEMQYDVNLAEIALNLLHRYVTGCWLTMSMRRVR